MDDAPQPPLAALEALMRLIAARIEAEIGRAGPVAGPFVATADAARLAARLRQGAPPPLADPEVEAALAALAAPGATTGRLAAAFGLEAPELAFLAMALLPDLFPELGALYAWAQDDAQRRLPCAALACRLLGIAPRRALQALAATAPLRGFALLRLEAEGLRPLSDLAFSVPQALAGRILGAEDWSSPDPALRARTPEPPDLPAALLLEDPARLARAREAARPGGPVLLTTGPPGSGRLALAAALAREAGTTPFAVDLGGPPEEAARLAPVALREARRLGRRLIATGADKLPPAVLALILELAPEAMLVAESRPDSAAPLEEIALDAPDRRRLTALWSHALGPGSAPQAALLAHRFRLGLADLLATAAAARADPRLAGTPALISACLARAPRTLDRLATRMAFAPDWEDLVLTERQAVRLRSLIQRATHAAQVHDDWGFGRALTPERGLTALFAGPSGTGKSLTAAAVARRLGLPIHRVDLSATVSKYIGETEKQLEQVFSAAEAAHSCLFFDECDALFGKRSEVSDAHDRYANIEISYLLQRLETHRGVVFLATNHPQNIDEAFMRRIDLRVDFVLPDAEERRRLWAGLTPREAGAEIDAERLGRSFELSGGAIRNALLTAAFLAADAGERIDTRHCLTAVAMEYEKMGRPLTRQAFGESWAQVRADLGGRDG